MTKENKEILQKANALIAKKDYEGFLTYCTEDTLWVFVGEQILNGKDAVRQYMKENYLEPPRFHVDQIIADGDYVTAIGKISMKDQDGKVVDSDYCDVWRFREGKMAELKAFVIPSDKQKTDVTEHITVNRP
ncbi:nuclear transport factor 2 family protein [Pedobacter ginsengisoli]|jgi:ketosteroid isomerase-like protein|uniref:nuclear transport factor 2 family protein n=1 Tax=Pedobacter ginsengisoli TaxID=363852 RepID=UPI002550E379|nr:nuclear transport factor 2 family protein [Pedobacter ginsengisoli]